MIRQSGPLLKYNYELVALVHCNQRRSDARAVPWIPAVVALILWRFFLRPVLRAPVSRSHVMANTDYQLMCKPIQEV